MSLKKKLGSKLAQGVREVQSQRTQVPATPTKTMVPAAPTKPMAPAKPSAPRANPALAMKVVHPKRVWPD